MKQFAFLIVVVLAIIPQGYSLKCNACGPSSPCQTPTELTCSAPNDRCFALRAEVEVPMAGAMTMEMRNCAVGSMMCTDAYKQQLCQNMGAAGTLKSCNYSCCEGDLCNDGTNPPASNLSCYECSPEGMGPNGTGSPLISCNAPKQRKCGQIAPGMSFDRCMTVKATVKNPITGALLEQEVKKCSLSSMCSGNMLCNTMNTTGDLVHCNVQCCEGDVCNGPKPQTTVTPSPSGSSPTDPSLSVVFRSAPPSEQESGESGGQNMAVTAGVLASIGIVLVVIFMFTRFR